MRPSYSDSSVRGARIRFASLRCRRALGACRRARTSIGLTCSIGRWRPFRTAATRRGVRHGHCGLVFVSHRCSILTEHTKTAALLSWPRMTGHTSSWLLVSPLTSLSGRAARLREVRYLSHTMRPPEKLDTQTVDKQRSGQSLFLTSLLLVRRGWFANHALYLTRPSRSGCKRMPSLVGSLSLGR